MPSVVRVGTRGSKLALAQANWVVSRLRELAPDREFAIEVIDSKPTLDPANPNLGEGIFVKEIQNALLDGRVDVAVHSLKDLPTKPVDGLVIAAIPERADAREAMIGKPLDELPEGARVGTSSPRRTAQLKRLRPDLEVVPLNGNIPTRLEKIARGDCDAGMVAAAGLQRLGIEAAQVLSFEQALPAPGQGALALEVRTGPLELPLLVGGLDHIQSAVATTAEREVLAALGGGCMLPVAVLATIDGDRIDIRGRVVSADGTRAIYHRATGDGGFPHEVAEQVAAALVEQGAEDLLGIG